MSADKVDKVTQPMKVTTHYTHVCTQLGAICCDVLRFYDTSTSNSIPLTFIVLMSSNC